MIQPSEEQFSHAETIESFDFGGGSVTGSGPTPDQLARGTIFIHKLENNYNKQHSPISAMVSKIL